MFLRSYVLYFRYDYMKPSLTTLLEIEVDDVNQLVFDVFCWPFEVLNQDVPSIMLVHKGSNVYDEKKFNAYTLTCKAT